CLLCLPQNRNRREVVKFRTGTLRPAKVSLLLGFVFDFSCRASLVPVIPYKIAKCLKIRAFLLKKQHSGIQNIMPRILLGSNILKKGVSWGGLKGSVIFALGFHSHGVLFPNPERVLQEATESLAQAESLSGEYYAQLDELIENKKVLDEALQLYLAGLAELEELKEAKGL
ncbi:unnamed protein product, partial [Brassica rapa]